MSQEMTREKNMAEQGEEVYSGDLEALWGEYAGLSDDDRDKFIEMIQADQEDRVRAAKQSEQK